MLFIIDVMGLGIALHRQQLLLIVTFVVITLMVIALRYAQKQDIWVVLAYGPSPKGAGQGRGPAMAIIHARLTGVAQFLAVALATLL